LIGAWLDHSTDTRSPVVAHFRRFGRFLMLGQREGQPPEAIVLSLAFLARALPITTAGRRHAHDVAIGYDRGASAFVSAKGGELGGACLADGMWLDADSARRTDLALRAELRRDPARREAARAWRPPPPEGPEGVFALTDPGPLAYRLLERYVRRHPASPWGTFGTLRAHESGHVADLRRHLPVLPRLPATVALFARAGFSPARVEMELERRAQLGAVVDAPDPDLALFEMVEALPLEERDPEVHAGGYRDGVADLVRFVHARPDLHPEIDLTQRILPQLERLGPEALRRAARAAVGR
jgi:hypothetical protein